MLDAVITVTFDHAQLFHLEVIVTILYMVAYKLFLPLIFQKLSAIVGDNLCATQHVVLIIHALITPKVMINTMEDASGGILLYPHGFCKEHI